MRKMKDSEVEWIGEIGCDFRIMRLKNVAYILDEYRKPISAENRNQAGEELYDYYGASGVIDKIAGYTIDDHVMLIGEDGANLLMRNLPLMYEVTGKAWINNHAHILKPKSNYDFYYLFYTLESVDITTYITGSAQPKLNQENLKNILIPVPDYEVQKKIAKYLDEKCSKIDAIIAKQETIIEKLKEYKLSIITETVMSGINDVPMKKSNIDLCESIPKTWTVSQIRYLFQLRDEKNYKPLEEVQLLSLYTDLGVFPHGEQEERGNKAVKAEGYKKVYEDDIIVNIILAWMGAIGRSAYNGVTSPAYDIYKPQRQVCSAYYHYLFRTKGFSGECYKYGRGIMAMRWRTYSSEFKSIKVPVPPFDEQKKIARYLDDKCGQLDKTIEDRKKAIEKLNEYKKSLIYEVVTGKKEV